MSAVMQLLLAPIRVGSVIFKSVNEAKRWYIIEWKKFMSDKPNIITLGLIALLSLPIFSFHSAFQSFENPYLSWIFPDFLLSWEKLAGRETIAELRWWRVLAEDHIIESDENGPAGANFLAVMEKRLVLVKTLGFSSSTRWSHYLSSYPKYY